MKSISSPNLIVVSVDGGRDIVVSELSKTEILPRVFVFAGVGQKGGTNRLAFDAPREIRISRIEPTKG